MGDITLTQRILRRPLNYVIERWFPKGAFYGNDFLQPFADMDKRKGKTGGAAALFLVSCVRRVDAEQVTVAMKDVTLNGENIGTWIVTVQKEEGRNG